CQSGVWQTAGQVPAGTTCGSVTINGYNGQPNNPASTEIPCQGIAFWVNGQCPAGYYYAATYASSALWLYQCVKS
ncbi:hypothetical protein, partial [Burkholderia multivorans]|uniref:hypothetical protein n=1 Tax=Burkholderia multivorans TaxID=87883 RepID=UPI002870911D